MTAPEGITALKSKYIEQIAQKKADINDLQRKLDLLDEIESDLGTPIQSRPASVTGTQNYSKMGLTEAAHNALRFLTVHDAKEITKSKIGKTMTENGFIPSGKNFLISVDTALRRLAKNPSNKITSSRKGGKRIYHLRDGTELL